MTVSLTALGTSFMRMVGNGDFDFFDGGIVEGEGNWGDNMSWQFAGQQGLSRRSAGGVMKTLRAHGLWTVTEDPEDGTWWALTAEGAQIARDLADASVEPEPEPEPEPIQQQPQPEPTPAAATPAKPMTRRRCIELLRGAGYTGTVSVSVPTLRSWVLERGLAG